MDTPVLIGISGVKRSGKGTAAQFIADWAASLGLTALDRGFADKAKWAFARQFYPEIEMEVAVKWVDKYKDSSATLEILLNDTHGADDNKCIVDVPFRQAVAQFATEGARDVYGFDHWVDQLLPTSVSIDENDLPIAPHWHELFDMADICTISDMRFPNELARVSLQLQGFTIKVRRKVAEDAVIEEAKRLGREVHRSELGLPDEDFSVVINNDTTLDELSLRVRHAMNSFYKL